MLKKMLICSVVMGKSLQHVFLFDETHCPSCLKEYHTRAKVLAHLRTATHCRQSLIGRGKLCTPMPGTGSKQDRNLASQTDGALPFLQAHGATIRAPRLQDFESHSIRLLEDIDLALLDVSPQATLEATLRQEICCHPVSWTTCQKTLQRFVDTFTEQDAEVLPFSFDDVRTCMMTLIQPESWHFLQLPCDRAGERLSDDISSWETWCSDLAYSPDAPWCDLRPLPRSLCR